VSDDAAAPAPLVPLSDAADRAKAADIVEAYLERLGSPNSRRSMRSALRKVAGLILQAPGPVSPDLVSWWELTREHAQLLRATLSSGPGSPASTNACLAALRGALRAAWLTGALSHEAFLHASDVQSVRIPKKQTGRALSADEISALFQALAASKTLVALRDRAILNLLLHGVRRAEVVAIVVGDLEVDELLIRMGKGHKMRKIRLHPDAVAALEAWLTARGTGAGPLFVPIQRGNNIGPRRHLRPKAIGDVCDRWAQRASILRFTAHDCRRTCVSRLLSAGEDVERVRRYVGHTSLTVTARYDLRPYSAKDQALVDSLFSESPPCN